MKLPNRIPILGQRQAPKAKRFRVTVQVEFDVTATSEEHARAAAIPLVSVRADTIHALQRIDATAVEMVDTKPPGENGR